MTEPTTPATRRPRAKAKKRRVIKQAAVGTNPRTADGYVAEHAILAQRVCGYLGATADELANVIGIGRATLFLWAGKHPELEAAITRGRIGADAVIAERLFLRAKGWEHEAVKIFLVDEVTTTKQPNGDEITVTVKKPLMVPYTHREAPETMAGMYWLNNRRRQDWSRRTGSDDGPAAGDSTTNILNINLDGLDAEERDQLRQLLRRALPSPSGGAASRP